MKKPIVGGLIIISILMLATSLSAQIYKYIDRNGQKRWTDDLSQVPVEQRESAEQFEGVENISQEAAANQGKNQTASVPETNQPEDTVALTRESLLEEKSELENQYQLLVKERKRIEQMKSDNGDGLQWTEINQRISAYNAKTDQYEARLKAYKEKIEAFRKKDIPTNNTPAQ